MAAGRAGTEAGERMTRLRLTEDGPGLSLHYGDTRLLRYVFEPQLALVESPQRYLHPLRTLAGDDVSLHARAAPRRRRELLGGVTWVRGSGYEQLANNGAAHAEELALRYAVVVADGGGDRVPQWARLGSQSWS